MLLICLFVFRINRIKKYITAVAIIDTGINPFPNNSVPFFESAKPKKKEWLPTKRPISLGLINFNTIRTGKADRKRNKIDSMI